MPALALTDHGYVTGIPTFYKECRKAGVEPILGCEFYHVDDVDWRPPKGSKEQPNRFHVVILGRGHEGWKTLAKLSTAAHQKYYYKPLIDRKMIEALGDETANLVVLSGCASSRLSKLVLDERMDEAAEELMWWRETFEHYYVELQHHDTDFDKPLNEGLIELARRYDVPLVITNDPHYAVEEDAPHHDALLAIQTNSDIDDPNRFKFDGHGYHLRSRKEMRRAFRSYDPEVWKEGAHNTLHIAQLCETRIPQWEQREWQIPRFPLVPEDMTSYEYLKKLCWRGLRKWGKRDDPAYVEALKMELKVIKATGISDFLLVTMECIEYARSVGIRVGPGRGSVCGSVAAWCLRIHLIDPIRYTLLFERFLNPARPSMPDIDSDFSALRRAEMFIHVEELYGVENVVHVCTYGTMKLKKAFQFLAGAYGIEFAERMRLSKQIEQDEEDPTQFTLPDVLEEKYPLLHAQLERLAGVKCQLAAHPAGVIIANPEMELRSQVPQMFIASSKRMVGQYDLYAAEATGLMKQDFLGLRSLDTVDEAVRLVEWRTGERLDPDSWVPDEEPGDKAIYKMCREGSTEGVFQFEGFTNKRGCKAVKPRNFEDLVSITALYRTGPIKAKYPERFIANRLARRIEWSHPALEQFLGTTWGVILYQEQVMDIAHHLAGFDMAGVDDIKNAIKHKDSETLLAMEDDFIGGCRRVGIIPKSIAYELWNAIREYSGYNYNRSHAVAYTMLSYQTARLRRHHTVEFIAALLATVEASKDNAEKRSSYLQVAVREGIKILPPDINKSGVTAMPNRKGTAIRFGLTDLTGVGPKVAKRIIDNRPDGGYTDIDELARVVNNSGTFKILLEANVLASMGHEGDVAICEELLRWQLRDRMRRYRTYYSEHLNPPETAEDFENVCIVGEVITKTPGGTKTGKKFQTWRVRMSPTEIYSVRLWSETEKRWSIPEGSVVLIRGHYEPRWENIGVASPKQITVVRRGSE
jgi:DNA polymerase-3 subunit alpha